MSLDHRQEFSFVSEPTTNLVQPIHRKLRYAMVGGGRDAFIGSIHRRAAAIDGEIELVAGALSSSPEKARLSGRELYLDESRNHGRWQDLLEDELKRDATDRIDFVSIVTPNHLHHPVALAFVNAGFNVVCDKPLVHNSTQADELVTAVAKQGTVFAVTYTYSGYPLVREMREMVKGGALGKVRKVVVEYNQGWLANKVEDSGNKQALWRTDPKKSGLAGAMGDIGSHAENLIATVTGLQITEICADLSSTSSTRALDDDANVLLRLQKDAIGVLIASQVCVGSENDLSIRVCGTDGTLIWRQENPNYLEYLRSDVPKQIIGRGAPTLSAAALSASRLPTGHPEGFIEAFANIYQEVARDVKFRLQHSDDRLRPGCDYPSIQEGARGVRFIERVIESASSTQKWTRV
jgi:predicted dehydrogenase